MSACGRRAGVSGYPPPHSAERLTRAAVRVPPRHLHVLHLAQLGANRADRLVSLFEPRAHLTEPNRMEGEWRTHIAPGGTRRHCGAGV